jgi:ribosomal protein S18 acetylase RimI-like enzyme
MNEQITIRNAVPSDLDAVIALSFKVPVDEKQDYWRGVFDHYVCCDNNDRHFLVAEINSKLVGFIAGEVRAWEFGSPPCGWVFTISVAPEKRETGIGQLMFAEICNSLKRVGVTTVRTMVERDNMLSLSFLRSQGLNTGRYVELEKWLD